MNVVKKLWRKATNTRALEKASGELELIFFETVYRVAYLTGISSADDDLVYVLYGSIVKVMIILLMVGETWYAFTETSSLDEIAASINTTVIQFITLYRYRNMVMHKNIYSKLAMSMESSYFDTSTTYRKQLVHYWAQKNENYLRLLLLLGNCAVAAWFLYPLIDGLEYNMFIGIRLPVYYRSPYRYAVAYLLVAMAFVYIAHFVMVNDLIMQAHLLHLVCQFAVLSDCYENILRDCGIDLKVTIKNDLIQNVIYQDKYTRRLRALVTQHRTIVSLVMELRRTLSGPMLGQLVGSGVSICFIGYQTTTMGVENVTKLFMSMFFLGYNLFEFYIICRWCEEITIQSQRVGEAAYCSDWESGVTIYPGVKSTVVLVIARANKPLVFSAGGMYNLSLLSYSTLVKTSYSALSVLLRFR
ncbi:hypothetical protein ACJJTC_007695 [Scirpophaga incertulas]